MDEPVVTPVATPAAPIVPAAVAPTPPAIAAPAVPAPPSAPAAVPVVEAVETLDAKGGFRGIFRKEMAKLKAEATDDAPAATAAPTDPTSEGAPAKAAGGDGEPLGEGDPAGGDGEPSSAPAPKLVQAAKYQLVNATGEPQAVAWPEGIALELKPNGDKPHQVKDFDELASLAVQGIELRRTVSKKGLELTQLRRTHTQQVATLESEQEETLLAAVFDDEFRAQLQEKLAPYRDPNVRKLASESRATKTAEAARAAEEQEADAERTAMLYDLADQRFAALLTEFPLLVADDALVIKRALHTKYLSLRESQSDEAAVRGAFNDVALRAAMEQLNANLSARLGKHAAVPVKPATPPVPAPDAAAAAAAHNAKVQAELARKAASRSMNGAGAPPVGGEPAPAAPTSWDEGRAERKRLFAAVAAEP